MEPDNFAQQLQQQTIRQVPEAWRSQVVAAAQQATESIQSPSRGAWDTPLRFWRSQVTALLWPSPKAWAGLAAVWLTITVLNLKTGGRTTALAGTSGAAPRELVATWMEQERLLSEVISAPDSPMPAAEPPKSAPRPRSEQKSIFRII